MNDCDWYAWRRSKLSARDCDCNGPKMQIVLTPHSYERDGKRWESVEADVTGECAGVWYRLQAYSMTPTELVARLDDVEAALIRAWNSLMPNVQGEGLAACGESPRPKGYASFDDPLCPQSFASNFLPQRESTLIGGIHVHCKEPRSLSCFDVAHIPANWRAGLRCPAGLGEK